MRSCLVNPCKPFPLVRIAFITALTLLLSGWSTCNAIVNFTSCTDRERKRLCSPIADHMERKRTADHVHGFGPPSSHDYAADL